MQTGWKETGGETYYFDPESGKALTDPQTTEGEPRVFDEAGVMQDDPVKEEETDRESVPETESTEGEIQETDAETYESDEDGTLAE